MDTLILIIVLLGFYHVLIATFVQPSLLTKVRGDMLELLIHTKALHSKFHGEENQKAISGIENMIQETQKNLKLFTFPMLIKTLQKPKHHPAHKKHIPDEISECYAELLMLIAKTIFFNGLGILPYALPFLMVLSIYHWILTTIRDVISATETMPFC